MISKRAQAWLRRKVAFAAVERARDAWRMARAAPDEVHTRAALFACVLAVRALRRASEDWPDDEDDMLDEASLIAEVVVTLQKKLIRITDPDPSRD